MHIYKMCKIKLGNCRKYLWMDKFITVRQISTYSKRTKCYDMKVTGMALVVKLGSCI